jgi:hypothetical protein
MTAHLDQLEPSLQMWVNLGVVSQQEAWGLEYLSLQTEPGELADVPLNLQPACAQIWLAELPANLSLH